MPAFGRRKVGARTQKHKQAQHFNLLVFSGSHVNLPRKARPRGPFLRSPWFFSVPSMKRLFESSSVSFMFHFLFFPLQPSVPRMRRAPVSLLFALVEGDVCHRRMRRSVGWGAISVAMLDRIQKRTALTTPSDGCAYPLDRRGRGARAIVGGIPPHRI